MGGQNYHVKFTYVIEACTSKSLEVKVLLFDIWILLADSDRKSYIIDFKPAFTWINKSSDSYVKGTLMFFIVVHSLAFFPPDVMNTSEVRVFSWHVTL